MPIARVCRAQHPDLDGKGAAFVGGWWNSPGIPMVYTSSCGLLQFWNTGYMAGKTPADLLIYTLEVELTATIETAAWMPDLRTARRFGDLWITSQRSFALAVPSVGVPRQLNYLLNPAHPAFAHSFRKIEVAELGYNRSGFHAHAFDVLLAALGLPAPDPLAA